MKSFPCILALLAGAATSCGPPELCDGEPTITPTAPSPINGFFAAAHAHNDYEHAQPLEDALAAGFTSVEVDIWFRDDAIHVSHDAFTTKGTLEELYLDKFDVLLEEDPSVHDDGAPFFLWLDLKDGSASLRNKLVGTLALRDWITTFDDNGVVEGGDRAVTIVLTGDKASKEALIADTPAPRPFARDSNDLALDTETDATVIASALNFGAYVGSWDGQGEPPAALSRQCACVVERAHAVGRKVRLFGGPDTPASWTFQLDHGVDFVNADDLEGLRDTLRARVP
jgi:hypothetical protein